MMGICQTESEIVRALLKANEQKMSLGDLFVSISGRKETILDNLNKLMTKDVVKKEDESGRAYYRLSMNYDKTYFEKTVICPKCKTTRKVYHRNQITFLCANPKCINECNGKRTVIWLVKPNYSKIDENTKFEYINVAEA